MKISVRAARFHRGGGGRRESGRNETPTVDMDMNNNRTNAWWFIARIFSRWISVFYFYFCLGRFGPEQPSRHIECAHQPNYSLWNGYSSSSSSFFVFFFIGWIALCLSLCDFSWCRFSASLSLWSVESNATHSLPRFIDRFLIYTTACSMFQCMTRMKIVQVFNFIFFTYQFLIFHPKNGRRRRRRRRRKSKIMEKIMGIRIRTIIASGVRDTQFRLAIEFI